MKRKTLIALIVSLSVTLAVIIAAIVMLLTVSGDNLIYMNSVTGSVIVASYRWVCLAAIVLTIFWIVILLLNSKKIISKIKASFSNRPKQAEPQAAAAVSGVPVQTAPEPAPISAPPVRPANNAAAGRLCPFCSTPLHSAAKFCGKCGKLIDVQSNPEPKTAPNFCSNCGQQLEPNALFCSVCGKKQ